MYIMSLVASDYRLLLDSFYFIFASIYTKFLYIMKTCKMQMNQKDTQIILKTK